MLKTSSSIGTKLLTAADDEAGGGDGDGDGGMIKNNIGVYPASQPQR